MSRKVAIVLSESDARFLRANLFRSVDLSSSSARKTATRVQRLIHDSINGAGQHDDAILKAVRGER
jgi:hypothetical protein